jgi:hypothetical protein
VDDAQVSESLGKITALCVGWDGHGEVRELDPPLEATPERLAQLSEHWAVGGYRISLYPPERPIQAL